MELPSDPKTLKDMGILQQKDPSLYTVRLCGVGGEWAARHLAAAADLAQRMGCGQLHLTVRQGIEIPDVPGEKLPALVEQAQAAGLVIGGTGARVRGIVACAGRRCRRSVSDPAAVALALWQALARREKLPHKFKLAVTGCPSRCAKPQENDLGVEGLPGGGYRLYVGGRMGRGASLGQILDIEVPDVPALVRAADACLDWYTAQAQGKERFGAVIDRVGIDSLAQEVGKAV